MNQDIKTPVQLTCITINTDASFHPIHKVGGYAFYIVCDLFRIQKGGMFKMQPRTAEEAEIMCIGNAISTLLAQKELPKARWLVINNDCKFGMNKIRRQETELAKKVNTMRQKLIYQLGSGENSMRHVKAHSGKGDSRSWVNEWCDKEAKKYMRKSVENIKLNNIP